jgi:hypothetical protein
MKPINLFYEEPDSDRWLPFDRHPRRIIRRLVRGKSKPGGVMRWFLNLRKGLDLLGIEYRVNDYQALRRSPGSWACVVGKPHVIEKIPSDHPIAYGPGISSHPYEDNFWGKADIQLMLISCDWLKKMYDRDLPVSIPTAVWPAGIETDLWLPSSSRQSTKSFLVYDKIRWQREHYEENLLQPILNQLKATDIEIEYLRYGFYEEDDYRTILQKVSGLIFLCEHETQGFAYLQALSCGVPILAWDRGGFWQDPAYFPHKVKFEPVSSVPYWDDRCGIKFKDISEFPHKLDEFIEKVDTRQFTPRDYIMENLTLEKCAQDYVNILNSIVKTSLN